MQLTNIPQELAHSVYWLANRQDTRVPLISKGVELKQQVKPLAEALSNNRTSSFVSLVLSAAPDILIIDIDLQDAKNARHKTADVGLNEISEPLLAYAIKSTYVERSVSKNGYHIVFKKSKEHAFFWKLLKRNTALGFSGEILSSTGFCTFTDDMISESNNIQCLSPEDLVQLIPALAPMLERAVQDMMNGSGTTNNDISTSTPIDTLDPSDSIQLVDQSVSTVKANLDYLVFKLQCLAPWPTNQIKTAYAKIILKANTKGSIDADKLYNNYDFWLRIIMAVKDYAHRFNISDLDALALLDSWSQKDTTNAYEAVDSAGLSGFECLVATYKSIQPDDTKVTYKTLDSFLAHGLLSAADVIKFMNKRHFCYNLGNSFRYACIPSINKKELLVPDNQIDTSISLLSKHSLTEMYANKFFHLEIDGKIKKVNYAKYWVTHRERREVFSLVFKPDVGHNPSEYNLWNGFTVDECKPEYTCDKMLNFIKTVIADNDEKAYKYILSWIANIIKYPTKKSNTALALISAEQGTGKTFFVELIGSMLGNSFKTIGYNSSVTSRFNSMYQNKVLVGVEEAVYLHNKKDQQLLKYLITDKNIDIERKGFDIKEAQPNYIRFIFTANALQSIHVDINDRRFQVLKVSSKHVNDKAYFTDLYARWYKGHEREAFFTMMKNYDVKNFDFIKERVNNEITTEQKMHSMNTETAWLHEWLQEGFNDQFVTVKPIQGKLKYDYSGPDIEAQVIDMHTTPFKVARSALYEDYLTYCKVHNARYPLGKTLFKKHVFSLLSKDYAQQRRTTDNKQHVFFWYFEPLDKILEHFERRFS